MSVINKSVKNNLPLPVEKMPQCWDQDERMNALFSPFRSKSANPQDWISKYKFWQNLIYDWLKCTMQCSFSIMDLSETFKRKGCSPLCLTTVVEELVRNNEIVPEAEFLKEPCESWTAWSIDMFVRKPLTWSLSMMKSYVISTEINKETRYIHLQMIKELGDAVFSILEDKKESILVPFSEVIKYCKCNINNNISDNTVMFALIWLRRIRKVAFKRSSTENELLIKITTHPMDDINEIEETLYKLIKQENELVKEIQLMEEEKLNIISETKTYLTKQLRQMAKAHLKKKIKLEQAIEKRSQVLENLQSLISSIQDTHSNSAVLTAYKAGSNALRKLGESGLTESNVREVMDDLSEILEEHRDVQSLLSETLKSTDSDIDLEEELTELMKLDQEESAIMGTNLNSSIQELEKSLSNLHVEDSTPSKKPLSELSSGNIKKKKPLAVLEDG